MSMTVLVTGSPGGCVTLKCFLQEKSARGKIYTDLICLLLLKYRRPPPRYRIAPRKVSTLGRQFTGKNLSRPVGRRQG